MVERTGAETSCNRPGEDGGGQASTLLLSTQDQERGEDEADYECPFVQDPPQLRFIERRSGQLSLVIWPVPWLADSDQLLVDELVRAVLAELAPPA
jgi:hypothetical protein